MNQSFEELTATNGDFKFTETSRYSVQTGN